MRTAERGREGMALLEVSNLGIAFGGLQAVDKVDLTVEASVSNQFQLNDVG